MVIIEVLTNFISFVEKVAIDDAAYDIRDIVWFCRFLYID